MDCARMTVTAVAPEDCAGLWPVVAPMLAMAYAMNGLRLPRGLLQRFQNRVALLWVVVLDREVVAAAETHLSPRMWGLVCEIVALGGAGLETWKTALDSAIAEYAKAEGCVRVRLVGRPGWARVLADDGYRQIGVVLEKGL